MMVVVRAFIFFAGCLLLAGCGTRTRSDRDQPWTNAPDPPRESAAPAQRAAQRAPDTRPAIVAFGDSLTAGFGVDEGKSYPDFLQQLLDRGGYRYRVVNAGISGDTSEGGVDRVAAVAAARPAIVIVELGANDGLRGLPLSATRASLDEIILKLKGAGARVVLAGMTLPPNYGPDYIRSFESIYTDLAKKHSCPLIPFLLAGVAESGKYMQPDGLHPNVEGNRRVAANVMKTLQPLL